MQETHTWVTQIHNDYGKEIRLLQGRQDTEEKVKNMNSEGIDIYSVSAAARKIRDIFRDIRVQGFSRTRPFIVGRVEKRMKDFADTNNVTLGSQSLYMSSHSLSHARRDSKVADGMAVSEAELEAFPVKRKQMDLFYDGEVFVYTDYSSKYIVHPNYEVRTRNGKRMRVNFITATKVNDPSEFNNTRYKMV